LQVYDLKANAWGMTTRDGSLTLAELANVAAFMPSDKASGMTETTVNLTMGSLDEDD
jgi:hypothetical protein